MARKTYIINSTSIVQTVEDLVNDLTNLQDEVERLADSIEVLTVSAKKSLGPDAEVVLQNVDDFRARERIEYDYQLPPSYSNELGENFAHQPYHPEPEPKVTIETPGVKEDPEGHLVNAVTGERY